MSNYLLLNSRIPRNRICSFSAPELETNILSHLSLTRCPSPLGAERGHDEEQVAEDGDDDGDHVEGDPAPLVGPVEDVPAGGGVDGVGDAGADGAEAVAHGVAGVAGEGGDGVADLERVDINVVVFFVCDYSD